MSEQSAQLEKIGEGLLQLFSVCRVVWWEDAQGEFSELLESIVMPDVQVLRRTSIPALSIKQTVELERPDGRFLIYEEGSPPSPENAHQAFRRCRSDLCAGHSAHHRTSQGPRHRRADYRPQCA